MRKQIRTTVLFLALFALHLKSGAQPTQKERVDLYIENIQLITDRSVYGITELVTFKAFYSLKSKSTGEFIQTNDLPWSKVLYLELITPDGQALFQGKYALSPDGAEGTFSIPENILTGNYYLRAYTRWMRNFSPYTFAYRSIKIINPKTPDLLQPHNGLEIDTTFNEPSEQENAGLIAGLDSAYLKRKSVKFTLKNPSSHMNREYVIAVMKQGANQFTNISGLGKNKETPDTYYLPETRGITITGEIVDKNTREPLSFHRVNLTIFDKVSKNFGVISDNMGKFYFSLPKMDGEVEVFLTVNKKTDDKDPIVLVDNDFCTQNIELPFKPIALTEQEKALYNEISVNQQLNAIYHPYNYRKTDLTQYDSLFYGDASFSLKLENYIELPTIQDYIIELIPSVKIRKMKNEHHLNILGDFAEMNIYEPLILIDLVTLPNVENLLKISPRKIQRIDVIDKPYVKGNIVYGGIISFISKKGDFAGIDLPESGKFFSYKMFFPEVKDTIMELPKANIPMVNNTLFWNANIALKPNEAKEFNFFTGDNMGNYAIYVWVKNAEKLDFAKSYPFRVIE